MGHPRLIFGAASFGMNFVTPNEVQEVLDYLQQNGITYLDTAGRYPPNNPGRSEELLGEVQAIEKGFTVDTKILAMSADHCGELGKEAITTSLATSLRRLGVGQVNTLHIHWPDLQTPVQEQAQTLDELYRAGKFKQLGISNFQPETLEEFLAVCNQYGYIKPTVYQGDYSIVNRGMEKKLLPILRQHGIVYNAFRTLASGFLSGKLTHSSAEGTRFDGDSPMNKLMKKLYDQESLHNALRKLETKTSALGITTIDAALRWAYYHSALGENDGIILGASSMRQLSSNIRSINAGPLPADCVQTLEAVWGELESVRGDIL